MGPHWAPTGSPPSSHRQATPRGGASVASRAQASAWEAQEAAPCHQAACWEISWMLSWEDHGNLMDVIMDTRDNLEIFMESLLDDHPTIYLQCQLPIVPSG